MLPHHCQDTEFYTKDTKVVNLFSFFRENTKKNRRFGSWFPAPRSRFPAPLKGPQRAQNAQKMARVRQCVAEERIKKILGKTTETQRAPRPHGGKIGGCGNKFLNHGDIYKK